MNQHKNRRRLSRSKAAEDILLQPWFLPKGTAQKIRSFIPVTYWMKMRNVFEDHGCLICGVETGYHSCGMCWLCYDRTRRKILLSAKRHAARGAKLRLDLELFRQEKLAKKLLARFSARGPALPDKKRYQVFTNPVFEALAARYP
jgi:hypothetical protein